MKKDNRGGRRQGAGRPQTQNVNVNIRCHPLGIVELKNYAKQLNQKYETPNLGGC